MSRKTRSFLVDGGRRIISKPYKEKKIRLFGNREGLPLQTLRMEVQYYNKTGQSTEG